MNTDCIGQISIESLPSFLEFLPQKCDTTIFLSDCTAEELRSLIKELDNGKSSDIPIKLIKFVSPIICPHLARIFNKCMMEGNFPDELKVGRIGPVYKMKGDKEMMENYRPVSILPIFGKLFEKIIYARMYSFFK